MPQRFFFFLCQFHYQSGFFSLSVPLGIANTVLAQFEEGFFPFLLCFAKRLWLFSPSGSHAWKEKRLGKKGEKYAFHFESEFNARLGSKKRKVPFPNPHTSIFSPPISVYKNLDLWAKTKDSFFFSAKREKEEWNYFPFYGKSNETRWQNIGKDMDLLIAGTEDFLFFTAPISLNLIFFFPGKFFPAYFF